MSRRRTPQPPDLPTLARPELMAVPRVLDVARDYLRAMGLTYEADTVLGSCVELRDAETVIGRVTAVWRAYEAAGADRWAKHARLCVELLQGAARRLEDSRRLEAI